MSDYFEFSKWSVWRQRTTAGFKKQVFVMYHSTKTWQQAETILDNGFYLSDHSRSMLGKGIYASSTFEKTQNYGPITFKLLVYPGRICLINRQGHPLQKTWQSEFGSAWTPPNTHGMVRFQENCLQSNDQIRILGVCRGFDLLPWHVQEKTYRVCHSHYLWDWEVEELKHFLAAKKLDHWKLYDASTQKYFYVNRNGELLTSSRTWNRENMY